MGGKFLTSPTRALAEERTIGNVAATSREYPSQFQLYLCRAKKFGCMGRNNSSASHLVCCANSSNSGQHSSIRNAALPSEMGFLGFTLRKQLSTAQSVHVLIRILGRGAGGYSFIRSKPCLPRKAMISSSRESRAVIRMSCVGRKRRSTYFQKIVASL